VKIPVILAQPMSQAALPQRQATGAEFGANGGAGLVAAGRGIEGAATDLNQIGGAINRVEAQKYKQGVDVESNTLSTRMDIDAGAALEDAKLTERDPDGYLTASEKIMEKAYQDAIQQAKYPETKARLAQHYLKLQAGKGLEARKYSNDLYDQRQEGLRDEGLENLKTLGANAPDRARMIGTNEPGTALQEPGAGDYLVQGLDLINQSTRDEKKAADLRIKFKADFLKERGVRGIQQDPDIDLEPFKRVLPPTMYDDLVTKKKAAINEREQSWDKYYKRLEEDAESERQMQLTNARAAAEKGTLTVSGLDQLRAMRVVVKPEEQAALYAAITATKKEEPSDPDTLDRLSYKVHRSVPTASQAELDTAMKIGKLNRKNWQELSDRLTLRGDHLRAENRTIVNQEMTQAEQVLRAHSGITTAFDQMTGEDKYLFLSGLRDITQRSAGGGLGGKENAGDVAKEVGARIFEIRQPGLGLAIETIRGTLKFPAQTSEEAKQALEEKFKAKLIPEGVYKAEQVKIIELQRAEIAARPKTPTKPSDSSSGGGKSLRPKTGKE